MITYGHEKYIKQAIEGIFMQKTNFPIELIIANDASPDFTDDVIKETLKNTPSNILVRYKEHKTNIGMMKNFVFALQSAHGKYAAICEGDDYWIDENKLQKQVDFLESNRDFSLCFTNSTVVNEFNMQSHPEITKLESKQYYDSDLFSAWLIPTATTMFKNDFDDVDLKILNDPRVFFGDIILFLILSNKGKLFGMRDYTSAYRINSNSFTNQPKTIVYFEKLFNHLALLSAIFDGKYKILNQKNLSRQGYKMFRYYIIKLNPKFLKYFNFSFNK